MRLTRFTDYSLRVLIFLSLKPDELASIAEIAKAYRISENHLVKIVHKLGQLGFVHTARGRNGGLRLGLAPEKIGLGEVVRQMEEDMAIVECFGTGCCSIAGICGLQRALGEALGAFVAVLDRYTLADLVQPQNAELSARLGL